MAVIQSSNAFKEYLKDLNIDYGNTVKPEDVPVIADIHTKVLEAVTAPGHDLEMSEWHTCETTHCRAGWVTHLAGKAGKDLEDRLEPDLAAKLIYLRSDPTMGSVQFSFYDTNDEAMESIKKYAANEQARKQPQEEPDETHEN